MAKRKKKSSGLRVVMSTMTEIKKNYADMAKVVPGAWATIKARRAEINRRDPKAKAAWERRIARNAEAHVKATARMYSCEHGRELDALRRDCPGFAENENADRTATALKVAMLEARDRSGMTQAEIAARMGAEPSNVSRLLHGGGGVNGATFAASLRACGFGFTVSLVPFPKPRVVARTRGRRRAAAATSTKARLG